MEHQTKELQATQACPQPPCQQPADTAVTSKRTGGNGCTNFSEISYEKTRVSYDQCEIASGNQKFLLAHPLGPTVEQAARFAGVAALPALATGAPMSGQAADGQPSRIKRPWGLVSNMPSPRLTAMCVRAYYPHTCHRHIARREVLHGARAGSRS